MMDTVIFTMVFLVLPIALLLWSINRIYKDHTYANSFEGKVERALAKKREREAIKKEVERRMAEEDQ